MCRIFQIQEAGFKKSASPLEFLFLWAPLSSPYPTLNLQVSFYGLLFFKKKNIYFYLFGCVASYLQHKRSLLFIMDVGSSSPIRDKTRTPCIGSTESEPLDSQGRSSMDFWRTAKQVTEAVEALRIFLTFPDRNQNVFIHKEKLLLESIIAGWRVKGLQ